MNEIRPAAAAGSRITVYLPGSSALASAERAPCDRGADVAAGVELGRRRARLRADPARAAAVVGAHGAGVVERGRLLVGEMPLLLAIAEKPWPSSRKPAATSLSALHGSIESAATLARYSGVIAAVAALKVGLGL